MLALSGFSNDLRAIEDAVDNPEAVLALDIFSYRLAKAVAALVVAMGRLDALVFTGGIGEHSVVVRSKVLALLGFLGLEENIIANADHGIHHQGRVSLMAHPVALVIPTNEELVIARDTAAIVDASAR
jgi:acetate kinase